MDGGVVEVAAEDEGSDVDVGITADITGIIMVIVMDIGVITMVTTAIINMVPTTDLPLMRW